MMKNKCEKCIYYHEENNTCQSKKCSTSGYGYVTLTDRLFCKPCLLNKYGVNDGVRKNCENLIKVKSVFLGWLKKF